MELISEELKAYFMKSNQLLTKIHDELPRNRSKSYDESIKISLKISLNWKESDFHRLSYFLFMTYGIVSLDVVNRDHPNHPVIKKLRRAVPSGGAIYPNELYLYIGSHWGIEEGLYHFNPYRHELTFIKNDIKFHDLERLFFSKFIIKSNDIIVFIANMIDKNSYKYENLSYKIQCLDSGITLIRGYELARQIGFSPIVIMNSNDKKIRDFLNLSDNEGIMGTLLLTNDNDINYSFPKQRKEISISSNPKFPYNERSKYFDLLTRIHQLTEQEEFIHIDSNYLISHPRERGEENEIIKLPKARKVTRLSSEEYINNRYSTFQYFRIGQISLLDFSDFLCDVHESLVNDCHVDILSMIDLIIYCHEVEGVSKGIYNYDFVKHTLNLIKLGDQSEEIKSTLIQPDLDLNKIGVTIFLSGDLNQLLGMKDKGYRIVNILAGIVTGRMIDLAAALQLGKYPFLSFDVYEVKSLLNIKNENYPLIMFFMGNEQKNLNRMTYPMFI